MKGNSFKDHLVCKKNININNLLQALFAGCKNLSKYSLDGSLIKHEGLLHQNISFKQNYSHPGICWDRRRMQALMHHLVTFTGYWRPLGSTKASRGQSCGPCGSPSAHGVWTCCLCRFWVCTFLSTCRCRRACFFVGNSLTLTALVSGCVFSFDRFSRVGGRTACDRS